MMESEFIGFLRTPLGNHLLFVTLMAWPVWRCFRRSGRSGLWALLLAVPVIGFGLALLALVARPWPILRKRA